MLAIQSISSTAFAGSFVVRTRRPMRPTAPCRPHVRTPAPDGAPPHARCAVPPTIARVAETRVRAPQAPPTVEPQMVARMGRTAAKKEFGYGLPGGANILGEFDPLNLMEGKSKLEVYRLREAELTHGRVAMLASLGFLVQEKFHPLFSGDGGPAIDQVPQLPPWLWAVMTAGIGAAEFYRISVGYSPLDPELNKAESALKPGYYPGDIGFDPLGLKPTDPAEFREMQEKELAHGRLAMIASAGFLAQEAVTKATWGTAWGLPDF